MEFKGRPSTFGSSDDASSVSESESVLKPSSKELCACRNEVIGLLL